MNWTEPPPLMRGDLFSLLEPVGTTRLSVPELVDRAQTLALQVALGERHEGPQVLMQCLHTLAELDEALDLFQALPIIASVKQRLRSLGTSQWSEELRAPIERRGLVLPQRKRAQLLRALPAPSSDAWFVALREVIEVHPPENDLSELFGGDRNDHADLWGKALMPRPEVNYRLFRFGRQSSDIVGCMNIIQEPGSFAEAYVAGDGEHLAMVTKDVLGIFEKSGHSILSGRLPSEGESRDRVQAMALLGQDLMLALRTSTPELTEFICINIHQKAGRQCGILQDEVEFMAMSESAIYVLSGLRVIRLPRLEEEAIVSFHLQPWFAEYDWSPGWRMQAAQGKVWISNGRKLVVLDEGLTQTLREIVLPEIAVDFFVEGDDLWLVHVDEEWSAAGVSRWQLQGEERA